ncbi:MAG: hypothetical protein ACOH16_09155 [Propionibacteriaceae bacterium]
MISTESTILSIDVREQGCNISSIVDKQTGIELLWSTPTKLSRPLGPTGETSRQYFDEHVFAGGWFPMFPMAGGPGSRRDLRLHGEAPRIDWSLEERALGTVHAWTTLPQSQTQLTRTIRVDESRVEVVTLVRNRGLEPLEVTAGEHPCFHAALLGIREIDLGGEPVPIGDGQPEHTTRPGLGRARIPSPAIGADLLLDWDHGDFPGVLVWQDPRGIVAVEPKSFVGRSADDVGSLWRTIQPGQFMQWRIRLTVDRSKPLNVR